MLELIGIEVADFFFFQCEQEPRSIFGMSWGDIKVLLPDPWCTVGDFNMNIFLRECNRGNRLSSTKMRLPQVIKDLELRDLPPQEKTFP